jgi:hypothetical protein
MKRNQRRKSILLSAACLAVVSQSVSATDIQVHFEAVGPVGFAPLFSAFHDGSFDTFDRGSLSSGALETLAEVGSPAMLVESLPASASGGAVVGSPVIPSGTSASATFDVADGNTLFQFASMLLPTNDWFIGNGDAVDISEVLEGESGATITLVVKGDRVYDAGTEREDFQYSPGNPLAGIPEGNAEGGDSTSEPIALVTGSDPFARFANIPEGFDTSSIDFSGVDVARITITNVSGLNGATSVFSDAIDLGQNWASSSYFGVFNTTHFPWSYKESIGWSYVTSGESGFFFYQDAAGSWGWSDAGVWPAYYDFSTAAWETAAE